MALIQLRHCADQFADVFVVASEQPCFRQRNQMLMTVQFPGDFVIANCRELKERNREPGIERRAFAMDWIEMPVDFVVFSVTLIALKLLVGENKVFVAEQAKAVCADFISLAHDGYGFVGKVGAEQFGAGSGFTTVEKELSFDGRVLQANRCGAHAGFVPQQVAPLMQFLREARAYFVPVHLGNTRQLVLPFRSHRLSYLTWRKLPFLAAATPHSAQSVWDLG